MQETLENLLQNQFPDCKVMVETDDRGIAYLSGECDNWQKIVDIGHFIGKMETVRSVVNKIRVKGQEPMQKDYSRMDEQGKRIGILDEADVVIVGAGVTGCSIARELSKFDLKIILIEKDEDVANGATKANNGDIHSGYLEKPGTLKAKLNVRGNAMYDRWAEELGFELNRKGNLLVIHEKEYLSELDYAQKQAEQNGVLCQRITGEEVMAMEPLAAAGEKKPYAGLYVPSMANVDPWNVAIALAENAVDNGVKVILNCTAAGIEREGDRIRAVVTDRGVNKTRYVINCAGVYADDVSAMAGDECFTIHPRKGVIAILDKNVPAYHRPYRIVDAERPLRSTKSSKGGGMATTIAGNNLLGPSADEIENKEDYETDAENLDFAMNRNSISEVSRKDIIRYFVGIRPATYTEDFFIEKSPVTQGLINVAGIQSPGLAAAPAIAEYVIEILKKDMAEKHENLKEKAEFHPYRKKRIRFAALSREEQDRLIKEKPEYGRIICRCETITEGEILDAIRSPIIPVSIDAIKRRTRAGMGRCQGGFCQVRVLELLARELGKDWCDIHLKEGNSTILMKKNRRGEENDT